MIRSKATGAPGTAYMLKVSGADNGWLTPYFTPTGRRLYDKTEVTELYNEGFQQ